jgi:hypothetical protein
MMEFLNLLSNVFIAADTVERMNIPTNRVWNTVTSKQLQHISMLLNF